MADDPTVRSTPGTGNAWSGTPQQLLDRDELSREEKVELLRQWELDLRERMVADDENMAATEPDAVTLDDVLKALKKLGAASSGHPVPTTHG